MQEATGEWSEVIIDLSSYTGQQGYIAIHHVSYDANFLLIDDFGIYNTEAAGAWIPATVNTPTYALTGLTPETEYEWQVQGVNTSCTGGLTDWSEIASFTTLAQTTVTQTIALTTGWNWFSTNVEITLADLQAALATAGSGTIIKAKNNQSTTLTGTTWRGNLRTMDVAQMYAIKVSGNCEIQLEGMPINPADHPITISNGVNWIGFPFSVQMTPTDAFAGFAANGDMIKNKANQSATYTGSWRGNLRQLVPGQGYIYKSAATGDRTLVFPAPSKAAPKSVKPVTAGNAAAQKHVPTIDIDLDRKYSPSS